MQKYHTVLVISYSIIQLLKVILNVTEQEIDNWNVIKVKIAKEYN